MADFVFAFADLDQWLESECAEVLLVLDFEMMEME